VQRKKLRFYFAYNSPYAFLANTRVVRELAPFDVEIEYKPVYSPRSGGGGPDLNSPKLRYMFEDVRRFADHYGIALNPGPFADSKRACLGFLFAQSKEKGRAYHDALYDARWLEAKDIGDEAVLAEVAARAGLDRREFLEALRDPRSEAALDASNRDAHADEVFGFPFFIYAGKKFWGNDRLEWLVRELGTREEGNG
jgi:2-hydroxychromene-2-carboxylate isomerase